MAQFPERYRTDTVAVADHIEDTKIDSVPSNKLAGEFPKSLMKHKFPLGHDVVPLDII